MQLIWLRSDLRIHDNTALSAAAARGPSVAVYLLSPQQWLEHDDAPCKVDFWLRNLSQLRHALDALNIPLLIRKASRWDEAPKVLLELCQQLKIDAVHANEEYGIHETRRDVAVAQALKAQGIDFHSHLDQLLFKPGTVLTRTGTYFQVFSQFRKVCHERLHTSLPGLVATPAAQAALDIGSDEPPLCVEGFETPSDRLRALWPAGEAEARRRLDTFVDAQIDYYHSERNFPAKPGTSQLSAYLTAGVISARQCLHAALRSNQGEFESGKVGAVTWINELLWREFYKHILVGYPRVSRHRAFRPETEALAWRDAPEELKAWQQARTGLPIIDAAMRQLLETGWMHNRLRMVVAMFLTKNLLIDWREGERFFMRHLIDGDLAANNGGWQWSSSTGTDSAPWFRIFNPLSQSEKFDAEGVFIKHWLPQLNGMNKKDLHNPASLDGLFGARDYPSPIVNLSTSRERALAAFKNLPSRQSLSPPDFFDATALPTEHGVKKGIGMSLKHPRRYWLTGASNGIGAALAEEILKTGAHLAVSSRSVASLKALAQRYPGQVLVVAGDLTNGQRVREIGEQIATQWGSLDTLILNAGTCEYVDAHQFDSSIIEHIVRTNLLASSYCIAAARPLLRAGTAPHLVGMASSVTWLPLPRAESYRDAKAGLRHLFESLRVDVAPENIEITVVSPGFINTPLSNDVPEHLNWSAGKAARYLFGMLKNRPLELPLPELLMPVLWPLSQKTDRTELAIGKRMAQSKPPIEDLP